MDKARPHVAADTASVVYCLQHTVSEKVAFERRQGVLPVVKRWFVRLAQDSAQAFIA